ncbi:hypothetical protein [Flavobacterium piscinae]|nr:hypothetical protein [Flavobacterium piscinae]
MEYDYAIQKNIKIIAFIHSNPDNIPFGKSEKDAELRQKLQEFRDKVATNRLVKFWSKADELPGLVALSLSKTIKTYPAIGWIRANETANPELYIEINDLRKENQELKEGIDLNKVTTNSLENLADYNDVIEITGKHRFWHSGYKRDVD